MKTVQYSVSAIEIKEMVRSVRKSVTANLKAYKKDPERYGSQPVANLGRRWYENAVLLAQFNQVQSDGVAVINKDRDDYYTFDDHKGDMFCPEVNHTTDPKKLKADERRERARLSRNGAWFHSLQVKDMQSDIWGESLDSIGGFIGNDFYGSGYDTEFYAAALESIQTQLPAYINQLNGVRDQIDISDII